MAAPATVYYPAELGVPEELIKLQRRVEVVVIGSLTLRTQETTTLRKSDMVQLGRSIK
jgi:hypothetical protein